MNDKDNTASGVQATLAAERLINTTLPGFGPGAKIVGDMEARDQLLRGEEERAPERARGKAVKHNPYGAI